MGSYFLKILFVVFLCYWHTKVFILGFNSQSQSSHVKCIETEKQALLNFKHGLTDFYGILSTWSDNDSNNNTDCCRWNGIECNNETGHVQMLDLRGSMGHRLSGNINITSLLELQNMEYLDLSSNNFGGSQIPKHMGSIINLRYLNLANSMFDGRIPYELGNLSKLEYIDLNQNFLDGKVPYQLGNLSQLRYLDLTENSFFGAIPFQGGNLPILHTLRLGQQYNGHNISIDSKWLSSLSSLKTLALNSVPIVGSSLHMLQNEIIELRLISCSISDDQISSLFGSHSNLSTSLSILDLSDNMLTSSAFQLLCNYSLNLQELRLPYNNIVWSSPNYPNLPSLEILDLSVNNLTSLIFQGNLNFSTNLRELYLGNCGLTDKSFLVPSTSIKTNSSSLVTLDLNSNPLKSPAIFHWISNFTTNLHRLSFYGYLEGPIPDGFGKVMNSLEVLDIVNTNLQGEISSSLGNICTLQELQLQYNNLSGEISTFIQNFSRCKKQAFQVLDLSYNQFTGMLPNLSHLTSLRKFSLSSNQLTGDILESHFTNLSKLEVLDLSDNLLSIKFGTTWLPPFQLFLLGLASCKLGPGFPSWLQTQSRLKLLAIPDAGIDDIVPEWFWSKLQSIWAMDMSSNSLRGTIPNLPIKFTPNAYVMLNSNQLDGEIPSFLSQADSLDLSKNKFSDINTFLCKIRITTNMRMLDLSNNLIMGHLPNCWEHLNSLQFLDISSNKLSGKIPQSMSNLVNLQVLVLRNNNITGELPLPLKNCTSLKILDLSENLLLGLIPSWIGENMQQLQILSLRVNRLFGSVPVLICHLSQIQVLDLSRNNLSGGIPTCLSNFTVMKQMIRITRRIEKGRKITASWYNPDIYESNVLLMWKGQEHEFFNPEDLLMSIDLSSNVFTGEIPNAVGYLIGLVSLNLSSNNLGGEIPSEIGNLNSLEFLDLSRNHFYGKIPSTLSKIDRLGVLKLSNNDLIGRIPLGRQLQTFDASSFEGNPGLCGEQINKSCPGDEKKENPKGLTTDDEDDNSVFYGALYMSLGLGFFTGFWGLLGPILLWHPWRIAYLRFLNKVTDNIIVMVALNIAKWRRWIKG